MFSLHFELQKQMICLQNVIMFGRTGDWKASDWNTDNRFIISETYETVFDGLVFKLLM